MKTVTPCCENHKNTDVIWNNLMFLIREATHTELHRIQLVLEEKNEDNS